MSRFGLLAVFVAALVAIAPSPHRPAAAQSASTGAKHAAPRTTHSKSGDHARPLRDRAEYWRQALRSDPPKVGIKVKRKRSRRRQPRRRR